MNAICYGAQLMIPGVLRFEQQIEAALRGLRPSTIRACIKPGSIETSIPVCGYSEGTVRPTDPHPAWSTVRLVQKSS